MITWTSVSACKWLGANEIYDVHALMPS